MWCLYARLIAPANLISANENTQGQGRKTIAPQDVMKALEDLEFPDFKPRLEAELASKSLSYPTSRTLLTFSEFNEVQTDKRNTYRKKVAADKASGKAGDGEDDDVPGDHDADTSMDGQPAAKKARRDPSDNIEEHGDLHEGDGMGDREEDDVEDDEGNGDETEEEEDNHEPEERFEVEEPEETQEPEAEDEALDNGDDSD
jgi:hypothetical protein